jgi:putative hydrolase of the HAD superfamily
MEAYALTTLKVAPVTTLKAVFFDAAGTLIETARPVGAVYASMARRYGMEVPIPELAARFRACFASASPLAFPDAPSDEIATLERRWWNNLVQAIFEPYGQFTRFDDYFSSLFEHFSNPHAWRLYPETEATLVALKRAGFTLGVVTNFDSRVLGILEGLGIASCFDSISLSSRVGYAKPAPEIFHAALALHGLEAEQAMHVGDSLLHDVQGAAAAGIKAVLVDRRQRGGAGAHFRVQSLAQVIPVVSGL